METKYTPGPLCVCSSGSGDYAIRRDNTTELVVTAAKVINLADATLYAAAPELLEALQTVWDKVLSEYPKDSHVREIAEAAIQKATI